MNGAIPRSVDPTYIWGDALEELERTAPDVRIVNLETSVTRCDEPWPKGINYRINPANVACLTAAKIDVCSLANNHVLDYGRSGVIETLDTLRGCSMKTSGAGRKFAEARAATVVDLAGELRVLVHAFGTESSGIFPSWAAGAHVAGVAFLPDLMGETAAQSAGRVRGAKRNGDITIDSIHWGSNWGYDVPADHVRLAHQLVDSGVDIVYGHSSHHPRPIEVYRNRLILYGCGDFINDYEGIRGHEEYRGDLTLMYFATLDSAGNLLQLRMTPMQIRKMRLNRASPRDIEWMAVRLAAITAAFGSSVEVTPDGNILLRW